MALDFGQILRLNLGKMNATDFSHYFAAKLIEAQARTKVLNDAMDFLIQRSLDDSTKRKALPPKRYSRQEAALLKKILGPSAVTQYVEAELVQFEEQFPGEAVFVREHIALSAASYSDAARDLMLRFLGINQSADPENAQS